MAGSVDLSKLLQPADFSALSEAVREKIQNQFNQLYSEIEDGKSKFEKFKVNSDQQYVELESQLINSNTKLETESAEKEEYKTKYEELEKKHEEAASKLKGLQVQEDGNLSTQLKLSKANEQLECEKREFALLLEKRDREIYNMNEELKEMSKKVSQMNNEKCEAIAKLDEVQSLEVSKEFQRKRLEQEKENLQLQIDLLTKDVNEKLKQLMDVKREKSSSMLEMQSQLDEQTEECALLNSTIESLRKNNTDQQTKIDNLIQKVKDIQDGNMQSEEQFKQEIQARVRLVELYKNSATEAENKSTEMTGAITELQKLLKEAAEAHTEMEKEKDNDIHELKNEMEGKEEKIRNLEQELVNANDLIESIKSTGMSEEKLETLFPAAAATSKVLKSGMTLTQIYNEYVKSTDALHFEKMENKRLNTYMDQILEEIQEKAPLLKKQREDYDEALRSIEQMTRQLDSAMLERQTLRSESDECHRKANHLTKENIKQQQQIQDLSNQVKYLLKEIEELRGGRVVRDEDISSPEISSSSRIISENLVTFRNIEELQDQNQKLLTVIRDLSDKQEREENLAIDSKTRELQDQLDISQQELEKLQDIRQKETEILDSVIRQRDMYRVLLQQASSAPEMASISRSQPLSPALSSTKIQTPEKDKSADETNKALKQLQETFTTYKKEKQENDKIVNEQIEKTRKEASDLRIQNAKLASQLQFASEKYKVLQGNAENYRKEIAAKTEKIQKYSTSITKHEMTISTLREDSMSKQEQLAQAQAKLENMGREKEIVKSSEQRLAAENESLRREIRTKTQLMGNFQAIQMNLERSEQDVKFKLGKQIETLEREKTFLKNRLETEEKQLQTASKYYEKQIQESRQRLESELANHQRTKDQHTQTYKQLQDMKQQLVLTTQKLHAAESKIPDKQTNSETDSEKMTNEVRDLKSQLEQSSTEIQSLNNQLQQARQHVEQYKTIADSVQQTMKEQNETSTSFKESLEDKLKTEQAEKDHLKERIEILENERQELLTENIKLNEETHSVNADLRKQLTSVQTELQEAIAKRESASSLEQQARQESQDQVKVAREAQDKYERELMLHAADMEALTAMKERIEGYDVRISEKDEEIKLLKQQVDEVKASFENRESMLMKEKDRLSETIKNMTAENKTLHEQMTQLSSQVVSAQEQAVESSRFKAHEAYQKFSPGKGKDDSGKSSEQLLEVIRYLRREKDIAEGKVDVVETECSRLKQRCTSLEKQLDSLNTQIAEERQQAQAEMNTAAQHAELMHKVENYNILLDSNKLLREEKNQLQTQLTETEAKLTTMEEKIRPLQAEIRSAQAQMEAAQNDSKAVQAESDRWKTRTEQLIEQSHKTDPEEHKRLLQEREELKKKNMSLSDDLQQTKAEVTKTSLELAKVQHQYNLQKEELTKLSEELNKTKEEHEEKAKDVEEKMKTIIQLRKIGRKYKDEAGLVTKELEEYKAKVESENQQNSKQANEDQIKQLEEKLKEAESSKESKVKELEEKIAQAEQNVKDIESKRVVLETSLKESEMKRADVEQKMVAIKSDREQSEQKDKDVVKKVNMELNKVKEEMQKMKAEHATIIAEHTTMRADQTKVKDEMSEMEKKLARSNSLLLTAKGKLQAMKENNEKLTAERLEMRKKLSSNERASAEESDLKVASIKSMYDNQIQKLEEDLEEAKKENTELQSKIQQLQKQIEELQKAGPSTSGHPSRTAGSVSSDRTSSSPSEAPKTANIRPIASSPAAIKPQTVPVQPQSAASRVTASIRPMAIAPTAIVPISTSTPTATVMPTTVTSQESQQDGDSMTPVQQLFPQPSGSSTGTRPTQQVQRVIPTQETTSQSAQETETGIVEPQQSTSRDTPVATVQQTNKRQRDDQDSPSTSEDTVQKRQKTTMAEESQEIPDITVTDENATTSVVMQSDMDRQHEEERVDSPYSVENIFEMESQDQDQSVIINETVEPETVEGTNAAAADDDDDDDPVIIVESDEDQEEEEAGEDEEDYDDEEEGEEEEEEYEGDEMDPDQAEGQEEDEDIYGDLDGMGGSQSNQQEGQDETDNDDVVIIDEGDDDPAVSQSMPSSQPSSQSSSQTLLPPLQPLLAERQMSVGSRNQLAPFLIGGNPYEDLDDCTVPSTPTLNVPRRGDGFAEAVSSPQVSQRFVFGSGGEQPGFPQLDAQTGMGVEDTRMDLSQLEDGSGRSVPSTPLHTAAPVTVITGQGSDLNVVSQSEIDINIEVETDEGHLEGDVDETEEIFEGDQGEDDAQTSFTDKDTAEPSTSEIAEAGTSQDDLANTDKSQDANKPKIQKIVWEDAPVSQPSAPPMVGQAIQSLSQPTQYRPSRGQRGAPTARRSFSRGGQARRSMRGRGNFMRRPPMY